MNFVARIGSALRIGRSIAALLLLSSCQSPPSDRPAAAPMPSQERGLKIARILGPTGSKDVPAYHALVIGINDYERWEDLVYPERDARRVAEVLRESYEFKAVRELCGRQATRGAILGELEALVTTLSPDDALLLFYAGHGNLVETGEARGGYIIPADGDRDDPATWIAYARLKDTLARLRARQVLLVSDSCYAGTALATRGPGASLNAPEHALYSLLAQKPSRYVLTSGNVEQVPDESAFAREFVKQLESDCLVFTAAELAIRVQQPVFRATGKQVRCGELPGIFPQQDGQFVFIQHRVVEPEALLVLRVVPAKADVRITAAQFDHTQAIIYDRPRDEYAAVHSIRTKPNVKVTVKVSAPDKRPETSAFTLDPGERRREAITLKQQALPLGG